MTQSRSKFLMNLAIAFCLALNMAMITYGLTGCASNIPLPQAKVDLCRGWDWFEIGRQDGARGDIQENIKKHTAYCQESTNHPDQELYMSGRQAGLVDYCSDKSGRDAGRLGKKYNNVCPDYLEDQFLKGYAMGLKIQALETDLVLLDQQISKIGRPRTPAAEPNELETLKKRRAESQQKILDLERL